MLHIKVKSSLGFLLLNTDDSAGHQQYISQRSCCVVVTVTMCQLHVCFDRTLHDSLSVPHLVAEGLTTIAGCACLKLRVLQRDLW